MTAPVLVLAVGNPSRGDDAVGPHLVERLAPLVDPSRVELLTDFQLQPEHALDLEGRTLAIFVDASVAAPPPFSYTAARPRADASALTHAMSPLAVLETFRRVAVGPAPEAYVLAIRGERFELGERMSPSATVHLEAALRFLVTGPLR